MGVGTGANLEFYPAGSRLHCVDPNREFEVFFRREGQQKAAHLDSDIQFIVERGESMPSVADNSVDAVVSTLVMCSVTHLDQMFREIRRVLVPVSTAASSDLAVPRRHPARNAWIGLWFQGASTAEVIRPLQCLTMSGLYFYVNILSVTDKQSKQSILFSVNFRPECSRSRHKKNYCLYLVAGLVRW